MEGRSTRIRCGVALVLFGGVGIGVAGQPGGDGGPPVPTRPAAIAPWESGAGMPAATGEFPSPGGGGVAAVGPGIELGALHVVDQQCPDGGWGWPHDDCSATYNNITGPIALGLLQAHALTGNVALLDAAIAGGDFDLTSQYGNGESRFGAGTTYFLWRLSNVTGDPTYSDFAETEFFDELSAGTYGPDDLDTAGWIASVQTARSGVWINLRPWEFHSIIPVANTSVIGNTGQETAFVFALRDGLDTLDNTDPGAAYYDILGLAGGVRGLAFGGVTSFTPAIDSPNHSLIDGISTLEDLANVLVSLQNPDGSWYWHSNLAAPTEGDKDAQITAYSVLALLEADALLGSVDYSAEIAAARAWLHTLQLADGGYMSYPGGSENTEVEAEILNALVPDPCTEDVLEFQLVSGSDCVQPGETVTVELYQSNLQQPVLGFQAFAQFDSSLLTFDSGTYSGSPYSVPTIDPITATGDNFDMASGVTFGGSPTSVDALLVTLEFTAGATEGLTAVSFRENDPPSRFSDEFGGMVEPCLMPSPTITIDGTDPVITCPSDITIECDEDDQPANTGTATATDNLDTAPVVTFDDSTAAGACDDESVITRTWTATDCAGNASTCDQVITVVDTTPPQITCPSDVTVECDESIDPANTGEPQYAQGFETDTAGWFDFGGTITRVASGTDGVPSATGSWHATTDGTFTRWGHYSSVFPSGGYSTFVDIYLDVGLGLPNDTRMDYSSAINNPSGSHRRDFIYSAGFYNSSDMTGPGAGTDRFVMNFSNNAPGWPKNPAFDPIAIDQTGWYTIEHRFYDSGGGVLAVDLNLYDSGGTLLNTWTLSDPSDIIGSTVGGNRYGWFLNMGWTLPIDNASISGIPKAPDNCDGEPTITYADVETPGACAQEKTITRTWSAEDNCGNVATCEQTITVEDTTPPTFTSFPADATVECDETLVPGALYGEADGGIAVYYNDNDGGEDASNRAFFKMQFDGTNDPGGGATGAPYVFDNSPLTGGVGPLTWQGLYSGLPHPESQFGLDAVWTATTTDGSVPTPVLNAYDNVDNTVANRSLAGPVTWAINDYKPHSPDITAGDVINSIIRSQSPGVEATDIEIIALDLSSAGTVYTMDIEGKLVSDGIHHWYTPTTPDSPMATFGLNGEFYFSGSLTYDSAGDPGTDLINFYEGTVTVTANSPNLDVGVPLAADNCDLFPIISYSDDLSGLTGCNGTGTVVRTWTAVDACGNSTSQDQIITVVDTTPPVVTCPDDIVVNSDAGTCGAVVTFTEPAMSATDNCGSTTTVCDWASGSTFPTGTTTVSCTVSDDCGNETDCAFDVTVNGVSDMLVDVELGGGVILAGPFTRCITFELWGCPGGPDAVVDAVLTFSGGIASDTIEVPCGAYECVTARDKLHTLRKTDQDHFGIVGTSFTADFTNQGGDDDSLVSGNLNDDFWIDILDFGVANFQWLVDYGTPDTDCATSAPHADVNGDGDMNNFDISFVLVNFLVGHEDNCCGAPSVAGVDGPITEISVKELRRSGLSDLAAGDLNGDGWLNEQDIAAFLEGARPQASPQRSGGNKGQLGARGGSGR